MKIGRYQTHPAADLLPLMAEPELAALAESIKAQGQQVPVVLLNGKVLDGRNRLLACERVGVTAKVIDSVGADPFARVWTLNAERRHLEPFQKAALAVRFAAESEAWRQRQERARQEANRARSAAAKAQHAVSTPRRGEKYGRGPAGPAPKPQPRRQAQEIAAMAGVSATTVKRVMELQKKAPEAFERVCRGEVWGRTALADAKREERLARLPQANAGPLPHGPFPVIYADPPWHYENDGLHGAAEDHYDTMPAEAICALPVEQLATPDAVLFLWATSPLLPEALRVVTAWGFTYKTAAAWVKSRAGRGFWLRGRHEHLLLAVRGAMPCPAPADRPDSVIEAPSTRHSEKPAEAGEMIERMFPTLAKVELFCRGAPRPGWVAWGNEVERRASS